MLRVVLLILLLIAPGVANSQTQLIRLQCKGVLNLPEQNIPEADVPSLNLSIDLNAGTVKGFGIPVDTVFVGKTTESLITFAARYQGPTGDQREASGSISRTTGQTMLFWSQLSDPNKGLGVYRLTCTPARQLF